MMKRIQSLFQIESIRYLLAGGATTAVNFLSFYLLREICHVNLNTSNFLAISFAILFAYGINKRFVFQNSSKNIEQTVQQFLAFLGSRLLTMGVEMAGVGITVGIFHWNDMLGKLVIQVIIVVLNYILGKFFVFNSNRKSSFIKSQYKQLYLLAFAIPFFLLLICCMIYEVEPFGDHSLVIIDGLHQYMPFFSVYQEKLQTGDSLFYSWNGGLGMNFMALWAYYLSSPLNLLIAFFPQKYLNGVVSFLIITKLSLASLTMAIYLNNQKVRATHSWQILIFSIAYALSSYMIGYSWNVMWLETMICLPLIILGLEKLIEENDGRMYCFFLFLSLCCNFYMTFMTCIFLVLYYLLYQHKSIKAFFQKGVIFAFYSLLAGAMSAVILIPTYQGLMLTSSAKMQFPKPQFYGSFFDTLNSHSIATDVLTNLQDDRGTNLYCGIFIIFLLNLYILNREVKLSVRIKQSLLVLFLIVSFNLNWLNYIWHGFHDQYGIPNRFAYLYIFLCITMAYQVWNAIKTYRPYQIIWSFGVLVGMVVLSSIYSDEPLAWYNYLLTVLIGLVYFVLFFYYNREERGKLYASSLLFSVALLELIGHTIFAYGCTGQIQVSKFFATTEEMQEAREMMKSDRGFYRAELAKSKMLDEVTWHRLPSVNLFGSTAIGDVVYTMGRLGFYSAANEYLYRGSTPLTDSVLGVKYLFLRQGDSNYSNFDFYKTTGKVDLYRNYQALPIGYMVANGADDMNYRLNNPFEVQNNWVTATMEDAVTLFYPVETTGDVELHDCVATYNSGGTVSYELQNSQDNNIVFRILPEEDQDLYTFITGNQIERIQIKNGENIRCNEKLNSQIIHIGEVTAGIPVTISLRLKNDKPTGQVSIKTAKFDREAFIEYYETMADEPFEVKEHTSRELKGTVHAKEDGIFFTSIPYEKGWRVLVDGEKIQEEQIIEIADAFLSFPLKEGTHTIEMKYTPNGFKLGAIVTIIGVAVFGMCNRYHRKRKK